MQTLNFHFLNILKTAFLKRSLIGCDVKLAYTENRSRDYSGGVNVFVKVCKVGSG